MEQKIIEMLARIQEDLQEGFKKVNDRMEKLEKKVDAIQVTVVETKEEQFVTSNDIKDLKRDVSYLKHKTHTQEEQIFHLSNLKSGNNKQQ